MLEDEEEQLEVDVVLAPLGLDLDDCPWRIIVL